MNRVKLESDFFHILENFQKCLSALNVYISAE